MTSHISKSKTGFRLPPDVFFEKRRLSDAWAYIFRHRVLGELGRILLQELGVLGTMERRVRLSHWFSRGSADSALGLVFRATKYT